MGKAPLSEGVVLQLEKDLIPISKEYTQTIASGQSTPRDIQQMVDDCYKQLAILANDVVTDPDIEDEDRMKIAQNAMLGKRMAEQYPLSLENVLNESPLVQGVRDFDLQEFAESKAREVVAARLLGMTKESYFSAIKQDGPGLVLGKTFSQDERLHPISVELRSGLIADFNQATTLDDFYSMAQNRIQEAREKAKAELNPVLL
jgi:hypothetical protein